MKALIAMAAAGTLTLGIFSSDASAQVSPKTINGGILNGKAVKLPKPEYPQAARDSGIEGVIAVNVELDENGQVVFAEADIYDQRAQGNADGSKAEQLVADPMLRQAAEEAARQAAFSPTSLGGVPIRVKGRITYNFVAKTREIEAGTARVVKQGEVDAGPPHRVSGGVLNGRAVSLPLPEYPAAAKAVRAAGSVSVQVMIDESGNVIAAQAVSGHPLLRQSAMDAASGAKFAPTQLAGQAIKVSGVLTYNFVP